MRNIFIRPPAPRPADVEGPDVEMGFVRQEGTEGLASRQPREDVRKDDLDLKGPVSAFFRQGLTVNICVAVCVAWASWHNHEDAGIVSWSLSGISMACLFACFLLHCLTCQWIQEVGARCKLAYLSVFLRMVAATLLPLSSDAAVRHGVVVVPLLLLALALLGYFYKETFMRQKQPGKYWGEHEEQLKLIFDLSSQVVTVAFAGLLGTALGHVKQMSSSSSSSSDNHNQPPLLMGRGYMAPDCFLAYSLFLGLLLQLLTTVPIRIWIVDTRRRMAHLYLRIVSYASLMFLVLASVVAAEEILQEWVSVACFVAVAVPALFFWLENKDGYGPRWFKDQEDSNLLRHRFIMRIVGVPEQDNDDEASWQQIILGFTALLFAALMACNSKYGSERSGGTSSSAASSLSGWFKCFVLLDLYAVLSYSVRMVLFSEMSQMKSLAFPKKVWSLSASATIALTFILVIVIGRLHPDEMKNIF